MVYIMWPPGPMTYAGELRRAQAQPRPEPPFWPSGHTDSHALIVVIRFNLTAEIQRHTVHVNKYQKN